MNRADEWRAMGTYFSWAPRGVDADAVQIFHVELGAVDAPPIVLVHGFPTSSIDWFEVARPLSARYRVCALDFPGFGFSDKPQGWGYSLTRDAELLEHYLAAVLGLESAIVFAHDRGSSVAMIHTTRHATSHASRVRVDHLVISNANIFLPLSNLTRTQRLMLDPDTGPTMLAQMTPEQLAVGLAQMTYTPARAVDDPEVGALAAIFSYDDGLAVLHETIQYLVERAQDEASWLEALAALDIPTTFVWGICDTVAPPRVVMHVWDEYMARKPGRNALYLVPGANHYLQNDRPGSVVAVLEHTLAALDDVPPGPLGERLDAPILVDRSRAVLPTASSVLRDPGRRSLFSSRR